MTTRINKLAKDWTDEELLQWANGEVKTGGNVSDRQIGSLLAKRLGLEANTEIATIKEATINALGQKEEELVKEEAPASQVPEAKETPTPAKVEPQRQETRPFPERPVAPGSKSTTVMLVEDNLAKYIATMKPGVTHSGGQGPATQVMLYRTIQTILRQKGSEFNLLFGLLLKEVHKNRQGAFNERYAFRYFDKLTLTAAERRNFERFLNLALTVCDPATRGHALKQVDVDATMEGFKDPEAHQRVVAYFQV